MMILAWSARSSRVSGVPASLTVNGTLTQTGRMGSIVGSGSCSDLGSLNFTASEVQASLDALSMRMDFSSGSCRFSGRLGGMRR